MKNIFVGNLSFRATEDEVVSLFAANGIVDRVSIVPTVIPDNPEVLDSLKWSTMLKPTGQSLL